MSSSPIIGSLPPKLSSSEDGINREKTSPKKSSSLDQMKNLFEGREGQYCFHDSSRDVIITKPRLLSGPSKEAFQKKLEETFSKTQQTTEPVFNPQSVTLNLNLSPRNKESPNYSSHLRETFPSNPKEHKGDLHALLNTIEEWMEQTEIQMTYPLPKMKTLKNYPRFPVHPRAGLIENDSLIFLLLDNIRSRLLIILRFTNEVDGSIDSIKKLKEKLNVLLEDLKDLKKFNSSTYTYSINQELILEKFLLSYKNGFPKTESHDLQKIIKMAFGSKKMIKYLSNFAATSIAKGSATTEIIPPPIDLKHVVRTFFGQEDFPKASCDGKSKADPKIIINGQVFEPELKGNEIQVQQQFFTFFIQRIIECGWNPPYCLSEEKLNHEIDFLVNGNGIKIDEKRRKLSDPYLANLLGIGTIISLLASRECISTCFPDLGLDPNTTKFTLCQNKERMEKEICYQISNYHQYNCTQPITYDVFPVTQTINGPIIDKKRRLATIKFDWTIQVDQHKSFHQYSVVHINKITFPDSTTVDERKNIWNALYMRTSSKKFRFPLKKNKNKEASLADEAPPN